jgi:hypothetical protein
VSPSTVEAPKLSTANMVFLSLKGTRQRVSVNEQPASEPRRSVPDH